MDFGTHTETWVEAPFRQGRILGEQEIRRCVSAYGPLPEVGRRSLVYEKGPGERALLANPSEIHLLHPATNLLIEVRKDERKWAELLSFFHDLGTVVYPSVRFGALRSFGMDLDSLSPKVVRGKLHFITIKFGLDQPVRPVRHVSCDISDMRLQIELITHLEDLERGSRKWAFRLD